jgi:ABC-type antimicrobial peptide transport system permease subunit
MTPYEYLTVFISVVLGLAVVHLLSGVALLLDTRVRARADWIHGVWTANVFVTTMLVWWFNFRLTGVQVWTLPFFLNLVAYSVVLYLMSGLLYPVRGSEVTDFRIYFEANRPRFFMVCLAFQVIDFSDAALERQAFGMDWDPIQLTLLGVYAIGFIVGIFSSNRTFHGVLSVAWLLTCIAWGIAGLDDPILSP